MGGVWPLSILTEVGSVGDEQPRLPADHPRAFGRILLSLGKEAGKVDHHSIACTQGGALWLVGWVWL